MTELFRPNFDEIKKELDKKELDEKDKMSWLKQKDKWLLRRNTFSELKSLHEKLGTEQLMTLASSAILSDTGTCNPDHLFVILKNETLEEQYDLEIANLNRKFLSKAISSCDSDSIIKYFIYAIEHGFISKEFIDSIRLNPNSTLFSKEYIEEYAKSFKKNEKINDELITEAIMLGDAAVQHKIFDKYPKIHYLYEAVKFYRNAIEMIDDNDSILRNNVILKLLLCRCDMGDERDLENDLIKFSKEYSTFKEQYACMVDLRVTRGHYGAFIKEIRKYCEDKN